MTDVTAAFGATARSQVYAFLSQAFANPDPATHAWLRRTLPGAEAALAAIGATQSRAALAAVSDELDGLDQDELAAAYHRVFGHLVSSDCPPYEGEYGNAHIFQKTQCLADNAGFLRAFGLAPAPGLTDRLDHISVELEFLHVLAAKEAYAPAPPPPTRRRAGDLRRVRGGISLQPRNARRAMRASAKDTHALHVTRRLWLGVPVVGGFAWLLGAARQAS